MQGALSGAFKDLKTPRECYLLGTPQSRLLVLGLSSPYVQIGQHTLAKRACESITPTSKEVRCPVLPRGTAQQIHGGRVSCTILAGSRQRRRVQVSGMVSNPGGVADSDGNQPTSNRWMTELVKQLKGLYLPLGLMTAMILGIINPTPGVAASQTMWPQLSTMGIFFISGLSLRMGELPEIVRMPLSLAFGLGMILFITTLFAPLLLLLPLHPPGLSLGLAVFCCMPTSLSTGVQLAQACNAHVTLALLLTVMTNVIAVFSMPTLLSWYLASNTAGGLVINLDTAPLINNLIKVVLLPLLAGAATQYISPAVRPLVRQNKSFLSLLSTFFLCTVPWMQISNAVAGKCFPSAHQTLLAVTAAAGLHFVFLALNYGLLAATKVGANVTQPGQLAGFNAVQRTLLILCSQKTLPVAVTVVTQITSQLSKGGEVVIGAGVAVIPCMAAHFSQIFIDSLLVSRWVRKDKEYAEKVAIA